MCQPYLLCYKLNAESKPPRLALLTITKVKGDIFKVAEGFIDCGSVLTKSGMSHRGLAPKLIPNTMSWGSQTAGTIFIADRVESDGVVICTVVAGRGIPKIVENASEHDNFNYTVRLRLKRPKLTL